MGLAVPLSSEDTAEIWQVLGNVPDPEIPVISITELGIVRDIQSDPSTVRITPTYTGCPATIAIEQSIRAALDAAGFESVGIETALSPPWTTDWISDEGRAKLKAYGIAPPPRGSAAATIRQTDTVECPRCTSTDTTEISRFGSTPCKALWQCRSCLEPFDRFKCH